MLSGDEPRVCSVRETAGSNNSLSMLVVLVVL